MQKELTITYGGRNAKMWKLLVNRLMPNKYIPAVGPFVFLEHLYPIVQAPTVPVEACNEFIKPHRGISTFTYLLSGEMEHYDSYGNYGITGAGGAQWMNAGTGINYNDCMSYSFQQSGGLLHLMKFWINLPSENKRDRPDFLNLLTTDVPEVMLPDDTGILRILIGNYGITDAPVKTYSKEFLYHIKLRPKSSFTLQTKINVEYAAFVPTEEVKINNQFFSKSELIIFSQDEGEIVISNNNITEAYIIVFGGESYTEPIIMEGPFVMNTQAEIAGAYKDFHLGKYGKIDYLISNALKS